MPTDQPSPNPIVAAGLKALDQELAQLPDGVNGAFVTVADARGMRVGLATRMGDGSWKLSAELEQRWARQYPDAKIRVTKTW
jgi:hypothetical protein